MTGSGGTPGAFGRPMRADARRNYDRILAAASDAIAKHGAEASLEEIARRAGVGSATLHRHFPSRQALLEAVFHDRVEALCARARELAGAAEPGSALVGWLRAVGAYAAATRGLAASLLPGVRDGAPPDSDTCYAMLSDAGGELLHRAQVAGAVRPDVHITDLLTLVNAISLVTEQGTGGTAEADRLLTFATDGISSAASKPGQE